MDGYFINQPLANFIYYCGYMEECEQPDIDDYNDIDCDIDIDDIDYLEDFQEKYCFLLTRK